MATGTAPTGPTATEPTATIRTLPTRPSAEPERFRRLAELIGQEAVAGFLDERLGVDAFRARMTPEAARRLFDWRTLNAVLSEHRLAPPRLRLEQAGADATAGLFRTRRTRQGALLHDLDPGVLNARLREGATLIVDAVNELNPPLQRLCAGLAAEFGAACQTNLYACWGTTQGFDVHWDDHDVFVVQVEGRKRWALYGATRAAPTRKDLHGQHPRPETPLDEIVLEPGDVLYLPRGYWHAAVGLGGPTLHLTVGLTRKTGADFLHWLADQALAEAAMRADLPLERDDATLAAWIGGLIAALSAREPEALAEAYRRHVEATQVQRPALSFPMIGADEAMDARVRLALAPGAAHVRRETEAVVLRWRGADYRIAPELEAAIRRLCDGEALTAETFEAAVPPPLRDMVRPFLAEMVGRGVFVARPEGQA